mmetsp:Transcript_5609/g.10012  ORF Transcript_5609/g.10012 Transcript_5609/m.10012 type:complete len:218 (+) Transcript_5609:357-1010(+)
MLAACQTALVHAADVVVLAFLPGAPQPAVYVGPEVLPHPLCVLLQVQSLALLHDYLRPAPGLPGESAKDPEVVYPTVAPEMIGVSWGQTSMVNLSLAVMCVGTRDCLNVSAGGKTYHAAEEAVAAAAVPAVPAALMIHFPQNPLAGAGESVLPTAAAAAAVAAMEHRRSLSPAPRQSTGSPEASVGSENVLPSPRLDPPAQSALPNCDASFWTRRVT